MKKIEFLRFLHLRGPNIWTYRPALEAWIDIGELEECPSNTLPGLNDRLKAWLPSLVEHRCSYGERGGFLRRLDEGTWPGHILEHVTLELQNLAGMPGGFGKARSTGKHGLYKVVVRAWHPDITLEAIHAGRDLVMAAIEDRPYDVNAAVAKLRHMADRLLLGPSTANIVEAATGKERRIPAIRLSEGNLVQLGYGVRQRRIWTAETDRTSAIAESISRDKDLTKTLLAACGVPVPEGRMVDSPADAWEAAEDIGVPVVVKPYDGNHARGISLNLHERAEIEAAHGVALEQGSGVLVERFVPGSEHRLLVVGGKLVAAARGEEIWIVGDGRQTVRALIDSQVNSDPRRGEEEEYPLETLVLEREPVVRLELERQGLDGESVPADGQRVLIQRTGNVAEDVTALVHPDTAKTAALAARIVGLDIAGIDLVAQDIAKPLAEQRGAIVEVNAGPSLLMHLKPAKGSPQPVGRAIVEHLFPAGDDGRIPVIGVTGSRGKTQTAHLIASLLGLAGKQVGLAASDGLYLGRRRVAATDSANWAAAERILTNRTVEAAVFENGSRTLLAEGLAYDRCHVGVVTNLDPADTLPEFYIDDAERCYSVLRTQIDLVLPQGAAILNACDAHVAKMAELSDGEVIFFAAAPVALIDAHLAQGRRAVCARAGQIVQLAGSDEHALVAVTDIPALASGAVHLDNVLAAIAAAWALGLTRDMIRIGVETFLPER